MKILTICDSFKGTLSSKEIGNIISEYYTKKQIECNYIPISDGGEGFLDVINNITKLDYNETTVKGPLFKDTIAKYIYDELEQTVYLELAEASGLCKVSTEEKNAVLSSTYGLGQLMKYVILNHKPKKIVLGIGGSATTDMGSGMLEAMGCEFIDENGFKISHMNNINLMKIRKINTKAFKHLIKGIEFVTLSDVLNPAFGEKGTVKVFSPQKGATFEMFPVMERNVFHFHKVTYNTLKNDHITDFPGAGAAGGVGYTMKHYFKSEIKSGIDTLLELIDFNQKVKEYDIIISGEGRIDSQSLDGKVISGINNYHPKRLILICGSTTIDDSQFEIYPIVPLVATIEESMNHPKESLLKLLDKINKVAIK